MPLLNAPLALHDIEDVEGFCARIVQRYGADLEWPDREDLLAFLVSTCWELSLRQDATKGQFSKWAGYKLAQRQVDWRRKRGGRSKWQFSGGRIHERPRPQLVSLDADDSELGRLDAALSGVGLDDGEPSLADQLRALRARGRRPSRRIHPLGKTAA